MFQSHVSTKLFANNRVLFLARVHGVELILKRLARLRAVHSFGFGKEAPALGK
jgi:hypothetical protein